MNFLPVRLRCHSEGFFPRGIYIPLPGQKRRISGLLEALRDKKIAGSNPGAYEEDSGNRQILNYIYFSIIKRVFTSLKRRGENPARGWWEKNETKAVRVASRSSA